MMWVCGLKRVHACTCHQHGCCKDALAGGRQHCTWQIWQLQLQKMFRYVVVQSVPTTATTHSGAASRARGVEANEG
jgi:hypothetical protein